LCVFRCPARHYAEKVIDLVAKGEFGDDLLDIITHRLPLSQGPEAYEMFNEKRDGCIKVIFDMSL